MKLTISILALLFAPIAAQAVVSVSPVHLNVVQNARTTSVQFKNESDQAGVIDVQVKKWLGQNVDGSDILEPTDAVILSRPVVTVAAFSTVTIRLIVKERSGAAEDAYRVLVSDITPPMMICSEIDKDTLVAKEILTKMPDQGVLIPENCRGNVSMPIGFVLPLFVMSDMESKGVLELQSALVNTGNRHVRISKYLVPLVTLNDCNSCFVPSSNSYHHFTVEICKFTEMFEPVEKMHYVFPGQSLFLPVKSVADVTYSDDIY